MRIANTLLALLAAFCLSGPETPAGTRTTVVHGPAFELVVTGDVTDLIDARDRSTRVGFRLRSVVAADRRQVDLDAVEVRSGERELSIRRGTVTELYALGARTVEQGFTLREPPSSVRGLVELVVDVHGLAPRLEHGDGIALLDDGGAVRLRYGVLHVRDRDGRELPATFAVGSSHIEIRYDDRDATYPVVVDPSVWSVSSEIAAPAPASGSLFGVAIAVVENLLVVGAPTFDGSTGLDQGAVYVFERGTSGWQWIANLTPTTERANARFGASVAASVQGPTARIVVGAPGDSNGAANTGMAYVFERAGSTFTRAALAPTLAGIGNSDEFGAAVAIAGDRVVVGAPELGANRQGGVELFEKPGVGPWASKATIAPSTPPAAGDRFGAAVAIAGSGVSTEIAVGAIGVDYPVGPVTDFGAVYLFGTEDQTTWSQSSVLPAPPGLAITNPTGAAHFGAAVAFDGETLLVGAPDLNVGAAVQGGMAYAFDVTGANPVGISELGANPPYSLGHVGASVAFLGPRYVLGAPGVSLTATATGLALVFSRNGSSFTPDPSISFESSARHDDRLGTSVAIHEDGLVEEVLVGSTGRTSGSITNAGAIAVATFGKSRGESCEMGDECASGFCVDGVCCMGSCGGGDTGDCMSCDTTAGAGVCAEIPACDGGGGGGYSDPRVASCSAGAAGSPGAGLLATGIAALVLAMRSRRSRAREA